MTFGDNQFVIAILNFGINANLIHKQKNYLKNEATSLLLLEQYPDSAQKKIKELARQ